MAFLQHASLLLIVFSYTIVGRVDGTGQPAGAIAVDGIYDGRLQGINVQAVFDMGGVRGYIQFNQKARGEPVEIHVNLDGLQQFADSYPWHVHDYPVRTGLLREYPCSNAEVGGHYDPFNAIANPSYETDCNPNNASVCEVGDFSNKLGLLRNDQQWQTFVDSELDLYGPYSIIGRSLVIHRGIPPENRWICANIEYLGARVDILRASLIGEAQTQGDVIIHKVAGRDDATIYLDVWRSDSFNGQLDWQLRLGRADPNVLCGGFTRATYGEQTNVAYTRCSVERQRECPVGDLTGKCGPLNFVDGRARLFCTDNQLGSIRTSDLVNKQSVDPVSVTISDGAAVSACGELEAVQAQVARVEFQNPTINGQIIFYQAGPNDRTFARTYITGLRRRDVSLEIRAGGDGTCDTVTRENLDLLKKPGSSTTIIGRSVGPVKTGDAVVLGNLSTKLRIPPGSQSYRVTTSTPYLPLFGPYSIVGNTLVLADANGLPLACGLIQRWNDYPTGLAASILGYQNQHPYN